MRRVLREVFRKNQQQLTNVDIIIRPKQSFSNDNFTDVESDFLNLISILKKKVKVHLNENGLQSR